ASRESATTALYPLSLHDALPISDEVAISAAEIESGGGIILKKAHVDGETRFVASRIDGDLDCTDAVLKNPGATALDMSRMEIKGDRKSTRLNSSHVKISYAVFCV